MQVALLQDLAKRASSDGRLVGACTAALEAMEVGTPSERASQCAAAFLLATLSRSTPLMQIGLDGLTRMAETLEALGDPLITMPPVTVSARDPIPLPPSPAPFSLYCCRAAGVAILQAQDSMLEEKALRVLQTALRHGLLCGGQSAITCVVDPCLHLATSTRPELAALATSVLHTVVSYTVSRFVSAAQTADCGALDDPLECYTDAPVDTVREIDMSDRYAPVWIPAREAPSALPAAGPLPIEHAPCEAMQLLLAFLWLQARAPDVGSDDARAPTSVRRDTVLGMLVRLFAELPTCNAPSQHKASTWLRAVLQKEDVVRALRQCLTMPLHWDLTFDLLAAIVTKAHDMLPSELWGLFTVVLLPYYLSRHAPFDFRCALLRCLRRCIFSSPLTLLSLFINYDCSPDFCDTRRASPCCFIAALVSFVTTAAATRFDAISRDQAAVLLTECMGCIADFVHSLLVWAASPLDGSFGAAGPLPYHWRHIHQLHQNKQILAEGRRIFADEGIKHWLQFAVSNNLCARSAESFADFLEHAPTPVANELKHAMLLALLKDELYVNTLQRLLQRRRFADVPIDVAFRDFVCDTLHPENQPKDKQLPESQCWGRLQALFGDEYARQNEGSPVALSSYAADALAGAVLFLHSATHNPNARMRFSAADWIDRTLESMGMAAPRPYMQSIYDRTTASPWGTLQTLFGGPAGGRSHATRSDAPPHVARLAGLCEEWASQCRSHPVAHPKRQPYAVPVYAAHVRPLLVQSLAHIMCCVHIATLQLPTAPALELIEDCVLDTAELCGALALNMHDLRAPARELAESLLMRHAAIPTEEFTVAAVPLLFMDV